MHIFIHSYFNKYAMHCVWHWRHNGKQNMGAIVKVFIIIRMGLILPSVGKIP